jgi:membrane glycosyltransferase
MSDAPPDTHWNLDRYAGGAGWRRLVLFVLVLLTAVGGVHLLAMALGPQVPRSLAIALLAVFALSFGWISLSFWTSILGFALRAFDLHPLSLTRVGPGDGTVPALRGRTAILVPVYNEQPDEVFVRLATTWQSLEATGQAAAFSLFVLSDTTVDAIAAEEAAGIEVLRRRLGIADRLHWRRRASNVGRKAGNIADWLDKHGSRFDHMIVFDADSVMSGDTMVRLAALMEASPRTGMIQTHAEPMGRETLFARVLQFSARVYGGMLATGHAFWQKGEANYFGHNAIIRVEAFSEHCRLPVLTGRAPLGGEILSHDFVEAAFMRRAGWFVWNLPTLGGSYEELPSNIVDYAVRDRRWIQGNLQHARLLGVRGLHWMSRLHLAMGIMGYLASPLWLASLMLSAAIVLEHEIVGPRYFGSVPSLFPNWPQYNTGHVHGLLVLTAALLFLPKLLALALRLFGTRPVPGGRLALTASVVLETLFSMLLAPVMMVFHSVFVLGILAGRAVGWPPQARGDRGMEWDAALERHLGQVAMGAVAVLVIGNWAPAFLPWLLPVVAGLLLAPPLAVYSSRRTLGVGTRRLRLFLTPEETPLALADGRRSATEAAPQSVVQSTA